MEPVEQSRIKSPFGVLPRFSVFKIYLSAMINGQRLAHCNKASISMFLFPSSISISGEHLEKEWIIYGVCLLDSLHVGRLITEQYTVQCWKELCQMTRAFVYFHKPAVFLFISEMGI